MTTTMSGECARNIHFTPSHGVFHQGEVLPTTQPPFVMREGIASIGNMVKEQEELSRLGSRPPRCEHKCRGCTPCCPIQVPTAHVGPQYANYEPEGWKCKCGSIFFNP
ncbi:hypothetical protein L2E82_39445 [Cichorium intybus]|uniref:Uncharacterized protein n=1 Tax=Cichorium intybus TaxID=13427 RepID=A0ACB9AHI9_CICIN|nr:hypothetical protein L2E82_39445 [Cichorium intybus]